MQIRKIMSGILGFGFIAACASMMMSGGEVRADGAAPLLSDTGDSVQLQHDVGDIKAFENMGAKAPVVKVAFADLAGVHIDWTNEYANSKLDLSPNGNFVYSDDNGAARIIGYWWVSPAGRLCLTSQDYWKNGSCFIVRGASVDAIKSISPAYEENIVYPVVVTR